MKNKNQDFSTATEEMCTLELGKSKKYNITHPIIIINSESEFADIYPSLKI